MGGIRNDYFVGCAGRGGMLSAWSNFIMLRGGVFECMMGDRAVQRR